MVSQSKNTGFPVLFGKTLETKAPEILCLCMVSDRFPYPPCQFLRKFTFEGAAVPGGRGCGDSDRPSPCWNLSEIAVNYTIRTENLCASYASELTG